MDSEARESTSCRIRVLARFRPLTQPEAASDAVAASVSAPGQRVLKLHAKDNVVRWGRTTFAFDSVLYVSACGCVAPWRLLLAHAAALRRVLLRRSCAAHCLSRTLRATAVCV